MTTTDTERLGLPSASAMDLLVACPGQPQMLERLPAESRVEPSSEVTFTGDRIHKARETGNTLELSEDEDAAYRKLLENEEIIYSNWLKDVCNEPVRELQIEPSLEQRLWLHDDKLNPIISGKLDAYWIHPSQAFALVVDAKTGFLFDKLNAKESWQLKVQAVLLKNEHPKLEKIRVAFNKTKAFNGYSDYFDYDAETLAFAENEIRYRLYLTKQAEAIRHAGSHCNYCPAKAYCPEAGTLALLPSAMSEGGLMERVDAMTPDDLLAIWSRATIIGKVIDRVKERMKALPDTELERLGLEKKTGKKISKIVSTKEAFDFLKSQGYSDANLFSAMKFSKEELVTSIQRETMCAKKAAEIFIKENMKPFSQENEQDCSLAYKK